MPLQTTVPHSPAHRRFYTSLNLHSHRNFHQLFKMPSEDGSDGQLYRFTGPPDEEISPSAEATTLDDDLDLADPYLELEAQTHTRRLELRAEMISGKGTEVAYSRHLRNYEAFWASQAHLNILAMPITATKVAHYLEYESTRAKRKHDDLEMPGTRLGVQSIKQTVSALESHRRNHQHEDLYKQCPESQRPLRDDERIRTYERAAQTSEAQLLASAARTKATGSVSDIYTDEELIRGSSWFVHSVRPTKPSLHAGIRNRTMLLISTATAFRGDNTRRLGLSDIKTVDIAFPDKGPEAKEMALIFISNQGKTNTSGRIDEHGAFRHRSPDLCAVGALAFYFFSWFHILDKSPPNFEPSFSGDGADEYGNREWYKIKLFPGAEGDTSEMSYEAHRRPINKMKLENDIAVSKSTHAGRPYAATTARENGASRDDTKILGGWSQPGSYSVYDRTRPVDAMLGAAGFNPRKQIEYLVPRAKLDPPSDLLNIIFPWVEDEQQKLAKRRQLHGHKAEDIALKNLLKTLTRFRGVLLQDAAVLSSTHPHWKIFTYHPFNTASFRHWAEASRTIIANAEQVSRLELEQYPDHFKTTVRHVVCEAAIQHQEALHHLTTAQASIQAQLTSVEGFIQSRLSLSGNSSPRKRARLQPHPRSEIHDNGIPPNTPPPIPIPTTSPTLIPVHSSNGITSDTGTSTTSLQTTQTTQTFSRSGTSYPPTAFQLSNDAYERARQLDHIEELEKKFSPERLRHHEFEWVFKTRQWLPKYTWWTPAKSYPTVRQIWEEYAEGKDGQLSVRALTEGWGPDWKRGIRSIKSESSRRKKITDLVEALIEKHKKWSTSLALRFLEEKYPIPKADIPYLKTTRTFIEHLQKPDRTLFNEILTASDVYLK
ncbi:hypothetical protein ONZ45_g13777 [Pleurotus djamor]|nr:hypothetical protein ONZ45_g13777 [Pleurotus djamor]